MSANRPTIAGIAIPDSALAREAAEFVRDVSTKLLFDHSRRVFLWASLRAERLSLEYDAERSQRSRDQTRHVETGDVFHHLAAEA